MRYKSGKSEVKKVFWQTAQHYERARFKRRNQEDNETVEEFIADLNRLVKHSGYGTLQDELACDCIIVGIKDREVSEKLQMKEKLTLEAVTTARQSEAVKTQQPVVIGEATNTVAVEATGLRLRSKHTPAQHKAGNMTLGSAPRPQKCTRCGKSPPHSYQQCPANDVVCHKCHKRGHYKSWCKTKTTMIRRQWGGSVPRECYAIGANAPWLVKVKLNGDDINFKVDTGADVTVISEQLYSTAKLPILGVSVEKSRWLPTGRLCCEKFRSTTVGEMGPENRSQVEPIRKSNIVS